MVILFHVGKYLMSNKKDFFGQPIVHGIATGPALISKKAISFLGDLNITTGEVTGELSDLIGKKISKTILVVPSTRGSAGAWRFIYQLKQFENHPAAIITAELPDPSVVQGDILAKIPIISNLANIISNTILNNATLKVDGKLGKVSVVHDNNN